MLTQLTLIQTQRLEALERKNPDDPKIVGWTDRGPLLMFEDGRRGVLDANGRLLPAAPGPVGFESQPE